MPQAGSGRSFHDYTQHPSPGLSARKISGGVSYRKRLSSCSASPGSSVLMPSKWSCPTAPCPHVPMSPRPHVPTSPRSVHSCWQCSCTYSQWQGHGVLLFSAACCATTGCTSRKHTTSHHHGTRLLPRCTPGASDQRGPRRGARTAGCGWVKPRHRQAAKKAVLIPKTGNGDLGAGGKDGFDPPREGEHPCPGTIDLCCHTRKETERKPTSSALKRFTDVALHCAAKVEGLLSSPCSRGRLTLVIFSRRQG